MSPTIQFYLLYLYNPEDSNSNPALMETLLTGKCPSDQSEVLWGARWSKCRNISKASASISGTSLNKVDASHTTDRSYCAEIKAQVRHGLAA